MTSYEIHGYIGYIIRDKQYIYKHLFMIILHLLICIVHIQLWGHIKRLPNFTGHEPWKIWYIQHDDAAHQRGLIDANG